MNQEYTVIGIKKSSFVPKNGDGNRIEGFRLVISFPMSGPAGSDPSGDDALAMFCTSKKFINGIVPRVGDIVHIAYNRWGKVDYVEIV